MLREKGQGKGREKGSAVVECQNWEKAVSSSLKQPIPILLCIIAGTVVSLLSTEQVHHFKAMLRKVDNTFVKDYPIRPGLVASLRSEVKEAMERAAGREDEGK